MENFSISYLKYRKDMIKFEIEKERKKIKNTLEKLETLKKEKNAVILAHYYVDGEVQALADYVGDSYYLVKLATTLPQETIILCGVNFMGESAKLLNPEKNVILADEFADCPMAHMVEIEKIEEVRKLFKEVKMKEKEGSLKEISNI